MFRTVWNVAVVLLLAFGPAGAAAGAENVVLRVAFADAKTPQEGLEELVADFEAKNPGIDVEILDWYGNDFDKLATHTLGGVVADLTETWGETPLRAMRNGFFLDLMPFVRADGSGALLSEFLPTTIQLMTHEGGLYGLPMYSAVGGIYYNTQMFEEAGLARPDGSWDWNGFAATARKVTVIEDGRVIRPGFVSGTTLLWYFPWLVQSGVHFEDPYAVPFDTPEAVRALEYLRQWVSEGVFSWGQGSVPQRTAAMGFSGSWELKYWVNQNLPLGATVPPRGPAARATLTNTDIWAITSQSKHPEAAWEFLRWIFSKEVHRRYMLKFGLQPAVLSLGYEWIEAIRDLYSEAGSQQVVGLENFLTASAYAMPQPFFADAAVINLYINPAVGDVIARNRPVRPTMEAMVEAATNYLSQAK